MSFRIKPRWLTSAVFAASFNMIHPAVAFGQESAESSADATAIAEQGTVATNEVAKPVYPEAPSDRFVSDGSMIGISDLGIAIAPPADWEVVTNGSDLSLVIQEKREEAPDYENAKYRRNITVAAIHRASPVDEKRAEELKAEMTETFSKDSLVSNFQVLEHRFFNYRGENDGLLVYSTFNINEYQMMQMHILVSGSKKQFLLSYTDLAERFNEPGNKAFESAWATMTSIEVTGETPSRIAQYTRYGAVGGGVLVLLSTLLLIRRKRARHNYLADADELGLDSDVGSTVTQMSTLAGGWKLNSNQEDDFFSEDSWAIGDDAPRTKRTDYVSNY